MNPFGGVRIIEDSSLVDVTLDWSRVRSRSRAERRMRMGHRQAIRKISTPSKDAFIADGGRTMIVHPVLAAELRKRIAVRLDRDTERAIFGGHL